LQSLLKRSTIFLLDYCTVSDSNLYCFCSFLSSVPSGDSDLVGLFLFSGTAENCLSGDDEKSMSLYIVGLDFGYGYGYGYGCE
jgi:hypothetical protein